LRTFAILGLPAAFAFLCGAGLTAFFDLALDLDFEAMGIVRNREEWRKIQLNFRKLHGGLSKFYRMAVLSAGIADYNLYSPYSV
jgi:hypothetical protein